MTIEEIANIEQAINQLTQHALSLYYRTNATVDFVNKKGGLAGASAETINAYNALAQFVLLIGGKVTTTPADYLGTLTQAVSSPQF